MICNNYETVWVHGHRLEVRCGHVYNNYLGFTTVGWCDACRERDRKAEMEAFQAARRRQADAVEIIDHGDGSGSFRGPVPF